MAWLVERTDFPGKRVVFTLLTVALVIPGFSVALGWLFLLNPRIGLINIALQSVLGLKAAPFNISTLPGMGLVEGLSLTPVAFIMTAVVFRSMDPALDEAASMGGANLWQTLRRVTVPLAWPGVLAAGIYVFTIGFAAFDVPAILGLTNRIFTFSTYVYLEVDADRRPARIWRRRRAERVHGGARGAVQLVVRAGAGAGAALCRGHGQGVSSGAGPRSAAAAGSRSASSRPISC